MLKKFLFLLLVFVLSVYSGCKAQKNGGVADPSNPTDLPIFWKNSLKDIDNQIEKVNIGQIKTIAVSPGGLPVYSVTYGEKDNLQSRANYNSAVAAGNPAFYARKDKNTKPVVFFLGPVHGQEIENIVGLVNLIQVAETGKDYRGKAWPELKKKIEKCRVIIIPCDNPDGRKRCPYDSFVGLPTKTMTKYGQGTRKDGTLWGWPGAKSVHPMQGDVDILGAYFNDNGINPMHDDFFAPMSEETRAILDIARSEAPDMTVSLHSHENLPVVLQSSYVPMFMKKRITDFSKQVKKRYEDENLPYGRIVEPFIEDEQAPVRKYFNLTSALFHISGTMSFTFECCHGSVSERRPKPQVDHESILDIELLLFDEMLNYVLENRIYWEF